MLSGFWGKLIWGNEEPDILHIVGGMQINNICSSKAMFLQVFLFGSTISRDTKLEVLQRKKLKTPESCIDRTRWGGVK